MDTIVIKFGGSSLSTTDKIKNAADRIIQIRKQGNNVIAVVSAMGKTTDQLLSLAEQITDKPAQREMDMLLTTGEQVSISLLTMALTSKGMEAISLTGWQAGIVTENIHSNARILDVKTAMLRKRLDEGKVVVAAGFQGVTEEGEITTLGRGGSDTTAVAIAAALDAKRCLICTDVTGVYTSDPRFVPTARKLSSISYDEMLELANLGAGVLHPRAVEFAKNYGVALEVRSSIENEEGTVIEEEVSMEQNLIVRGVAFEKGMTRLTILGLNNELNGLSSIFTVLADHQIDVDIIIQSQTDTNKTNLSFSIKTKDLDNVIEVLEQHRQEIGYEGLEHEAELAKVSIVGSGMVSNPGVAARMFQILAKKQIQVKMVSTSEIKISVVVNEDQMELAAQTLHEEYDLGAVPAEATN
ncbi:aspartate kinase [Lederbergia galactosidilytica]|uniref:Aspartokinase n=1 Tax=Lederbergia galactosidilytica TaxID=217031 RepID=A0A177ZKD0_9BACI|nr:aspartate kinase [Lederbergia galactosidilytica]KRG14462.1 aspartate kinase [Virgibacillus soli]MBP1914997.1 aspartate kinase [Lederbergia galactosidilytica]OAK68275.1 aspartate kinase [Lederbergia galactosidilytica]